MNEQKDLCLMYGISQDGRLFFFSPKGIVYLDCGTLCTALLDGCDF